MRNKFRLVLPSAAIIVLACVSSKNISNADPLLREVKDKTLIPEGIAVHPINNTIYLSSLHQNKIVSVNKDGTVKDVIASNQNGFMWGLGMKFSKDGKVLWACSANQEGKTALFAIDIASGKVLNKYTHDSARFLNDLVILDDGRLFITDTQQGGVFALLSGELKLWIKDEKLQWANGITTNKSEKYLFVASGSKGLQRIDLATKEITSATQNKRTDYAIDGLVYSDNILYAAIGWPQDKTYQHRILKYYLNDEQYVAKVDTLIIGKSYFNCPTTLAVHNAELFALGNTNLGIYNRHQQKVDNIMDSLSYPVISRFKIK
jgi:hypothetical protein